MIRTTRSTHTHRALNLARATTASGLLLCALSLPAAASGCPGAVPDPLPYAEATLPLGSSSAPGNELWECMGENLVARNVSNPTLTPVLPAAGKGNGAAVIVVPGGGFEMLSMTQEGFAVAEWLAQRGIAAFVLKYRLNSTPVSTQEWQSSSAEKMKKLREETADTPRLPAPPEAVADAVAAARLVRENAGKWNIDPQRIGMLGFSAGAMVTLELGDLDDPAVRPDFIAPVYPPMWKRTVPQHAPPMFLAISLDDSLFTAGRPLDLLNAWEASGRPFEAHLYQSGGHGFGMDGNGAATALWADEFYAWMDDRALLVAGSGYSVDRTPISRLLEDPQARALLDKYLPGFSTNPGLKMADSLSLAKLHQYAPDQVSEDNLQRIQAGFEAL